MSAVRGVSTLQDILDRCRVDEVTGCWEWALAINCIRGSAVPMVHISIGAMLGQHAVAKKVTMPAARAAWLLAGNVIKPGHVVWRAHCGNDHCVNPAHCASGTRAQMGRSRAASGREKGTPAKRKAALAQALKIALPRDVVVQLEARIAAGELRKTIAQTMGVNRTTIRRIALGQHPNSTGRIRVIPGASVFTLGAAV